MASSSFNKPAVVERLERRRLLDALPIGPEFRINTFTTALITEPDIARAVDGSFVAVWRSSDFQQGIYARRYDAAGVALGDEFLVNNAPPSGFPGDPCVAMDADGDFVVAWTGQDGDVSGIRARRFNSAGVAQGLEFTVNGVTASLQQFPAVDMDPVGNFVVTWTSHNQDAIQSLGVYARRFNSAGVALGAEFRVNSFTTSTQEYSDVAIDDNGDFVITWMSLDQQVQFRFAVYFQRYNSAGVAQGGEILASSATATSDQTFPRVASDADGDFVICWNGSGVTTRLFDSSGAALGQPFDVNTDFGFSPDVAMDADGDFVVSWTGYDGSQRGVFARCLNPDGSPANDQFRVNTTTALGQENPAVAMDPQGNFVVAWAHKVGTFDDRINGQRYAIPDLLPPTIVTSQLQYLSQQAISITFNEPLDPATVSATDLSALNLDDATTPVANSVILSAGNTVATWVFNTPGTFISDGDYTFTLPAGAVSDVAGNALAAQYQVTGAGIWFLAADANRDRVVNANDFSILATNFGMTGKDFSQGDFNYDTIVNANDFSILATRFGTALAPRVSSRVPSFGQSRIRDALADELI